jgi:putative Mn2+ efflux pump MntP
VLTLIALILPLGLDTFVVSTAVGASGLPVKNRLRVALLFTLFEGAMPLAGLGLGASLSSAIGSSAEYGAIALLVGFGLYVLLFEDENGPTNKIGRLTGALGWGTVLLGLSISLDELAIGFSLGLLQIPTVAAVIFIAVQAFVAAQLGLRIGTRANQAIREGAEKLVGVALVGVGLLLLVEKLIA